MWQPLATIAWMSIQSWTRQYATGNAVDFAINIKQLGFRDSGYQRDRQR